jgi:hypothetical protein
VASAVVKRNPVTPLSFGKIEQLVYAIKQIKNESSDVISRIKDLDKISHLRGHYLL